MSFADSADPKLLKAILEPLLEDFQFWFGRSQSFLESTVVPFLPPEQQADLLARVVQAKQEVTAAQSLFYATGGQVGIEVSALAPWHQLVSECWRVRNRFQQDQTQLSSEN